MISRSRYLIWVAVLIIAAAACADETEDERLTATTATTQAPVEQPPSTQTARVTTTLASMETAEAAMEAAEEAMVVEAEARATRAATFAAAAAAATAEAAMAMEEAEDAAGAATTPATTPATTASTAAGPPEGFNQIGGSATVNDAPYDLTFFEHYGVNPFVDTEDNHLSTFAIDVDTASYTVARFFVQDGYLPDPASVRVEEFVKGLIYLG